ncbi:MAG: S41 family peptidase [Caldilinea sp.]|nr:S41 family peptidase [Caldilinea sp.]MCB9113751.1 S41 family peptidase [Caldilineaceae bacterium]MCB9123021.1 S41 family peptidase [Caldilineaceae bacterium]MCO5212601.1 S41 family peptidase [Caldilinea sp.]MCW5839946.1 S41 family peptidase [Caldilinea sp.]
MGITLAGALSFMFLAGTATGFMARPALAADHPPQFDVFWEVWDLVDQHFVDQGNIDPMRMTYGAINGMLATLGDDNHTIFFSPEEAEQQESQLDGSFEGIGAFVEGHETGFRIVAPIHGSPAEEAGILAGDIVLKVDGEDIGGIPEWEIISRIRGPAGTSVVLTVLHPNETEPTDITVVRGKIDVESVTWARIPETNYIYLQISQFASDTGDELQKSLEAIDAKVAAGEAIDGVVLDLRNNPGGYLQEALRVNTQFLDAGKVILHERDAEGEIRTYRSVGKGLARTYPMIVLINQGTASAGEITAGALKENGRARLVGQPTLGTGTVLQPFNLSDGSVLRLGVTNWLTPEKNLIKGEGVQPDSLVDQDPAVPMVDSYTLEEAKTLREVLGAGDKQFNLALLQLRLLPQTVE